MDLVDVEYQAERRADDLRAAEAQVRLDEAQRASAPQSKSKRMKHAVGDKLVEIGKRLQDSATLPEPTPNLRCLSISSPFPIPWRQEWATIENSKRAFLK